MVFYCLIGNVKKIKEAAMKKIRLKPYMAIISGDVDTPVTLYQKKYVGDKIGFFY